MVDASNRRAIKSDQAPWLVSLQNDMMLITAQAAQRHWPGPQPGSDPYFNYRFEHVQQVEREALNLLNEPDLQLADPEIVLAAVWIHDRYKPQYEGDDHARQAADWAREHLAGSGFPPGKVQAVVFAVEHHADPPGTLSESAIEARLVWDADKLTKIGPLNIISKLVSHPAYPEQNITYTGMALLGLEQLEKSRRLVDEFYFEASRALARVRFAQQKEFYEMLARDVDA
jgi:hypothetical protein